MKRATKATAVSIVPAFEEVLSKTNNRALPVIVWDESERGSGRKQKVVREPDFVAAFELACERIRILEAELFTVAQIARANFH